MRPRNEIVPPASTRCASTQDAVPELPPQRTSRSEGRTAFATGAGCGEPLSGTGAPPEPVASATLGIVATPIEAISPSAANPFAPRLSKAAKRCASKDDKQPLFLTPTELAVGLALKELRYT